MMSKKEETVNNNYTAKDLICVFCGGNVWGHSCENFVKYWCDDCGANNKKNPPSIEINHE